MITSMDCTDGMAFNPRFLDVAEEPKKMLLPIDGYEQVAFVTLEEAIEPVANIVPGIHEKIYVAKCNCEKPEHGLTSDQAGAIQLYTMGGSSNDRCLYHVLNSILRSDQPDRIDLLKPWFFYLKLFITALAHIPSYRGTVYRGVTSDLSEYYTKDKKFVWWGFSSCTKTLGVLQSELYLGRKGVGTLFIIECFSGKDISQYSYFSTEEEVVLVAARQFVVISHLNPAPHLWIIHVKEIEPPFPFLKTDSSISSTFEITSTDDKCSVPPPNLCSKCSKTISNLLTSNAETTKDDLLCNIISSDVGNIDTINKSESVEASLPSLLSSVLINSSSPQLNEGISGNVPSTDSVCTRHTTNPNTVVGVTSVVKDEDEKVVCFKNTKITPEAAKLIAKEIHKNTVLEIFYFANNNLNDEGLSHLMQVIHDRLLVQVGINGNKITDVSATLIAELLSKAPHAMATLQLHKNLITSQGVKSIIQALKLNSNSQLKSLSFSGNRLIDDECINDLIDVLKENRTLRVLYLEKCNLSEDGKQRLQKALQENKTLHIHV